MQNILLCLIVVYIVLRYIVFVQFSSDNVMQIIGIVENLLVREISLIPDRSKKFSEIWFSSITIVAVDVLCVGGKIIAILDRRP